MKKIIIYLFISLLMVSNSWAVIITSSGVTKEEAINNGLRQAIEMYTGSLVYGVTDVQKFELQKDDIVAASLGHVKKYHIVKVSKADDLINVTMDVTLSEDKIIQIMRERVDLITYQEILKDYNNVAQRQEQIRKLAEMLKILDSRPLHERYGVIYDGYQIKHIGATYVDVTLNVRVTENPFFSRVYNEILKNLSLDEDSLETQTVGGKYRFENGRLTGARYYIPKDVDTLSVEGLKAQIHVDGKPVDKCRRYQDNLQVVIDPVVLIEGLIKLFPQAFKHAWNDEAITIDKKWHHAAIQKSKVIPPEGLPMKVKYRISDAAEIKTLQNLKLTMEPCGR